jgi:ADP-ribose pyrophosphatase YjhB (NUDIX family)
MVPEVRAAGRPSPRYLLAFGRCGCHESTRWDARRFLLALAGRHNENHDGVRHGHGTRVKASGVSGRPLRLAARVIVLDPGDRVLLMRYDNGPPDASHWATPGGGLNKAEDYPAAALRELAEETGWHDITLLDEVARRTLTMPYGGQLVHQRERLYLARTGQACREIRGVEAMHAADGIAAWRWWTLAELDATAETVWPAGLADLIRHALGHA